MIGLAPLIPLMKKILLCTLLVASLPVLAANDFASAQALFEQKKYPEALALYTRLASAGNVEAQQQLGQMYWYGEAGAVDEAKAESWFRKAAAKGNSVAIASLDLIKQRGARRAEITHWVEQYQGEDLKTGQFNCSVPRIPSISKQSADIERVAASIATWQNCYNNYVTNLNAASPLVKRIPADIVKLMNQAETTRAAERLAQVQENLAEEARVNAKLVLADVAAWRSATDAYIKERNAIVESAPSEERARELEARKRNYK